jgi:hypothetical protein
MSDDADFTIRVAEANERIRQASVTFDESIRNYRRFMAVRVAMLWLAVGMLPLVVAICLFVMVDHGRFTPTTVSLAAGTLFVEVVGVLVIFWKSLAKVAEPPIPKPVIDMVSPMAIGRPSSVQEISSTATSVDSVPKTMAVGPGSRE